MSEGIQGDGGEAMIEPDDCDKRINKAIDVKDDQHVQLEVHLTTANNKVYNLTLQLKLLRKQYQDVSKDNDILRSDLTVSHANLDFIRENTTNYEVANDLMESKRKVFELKEFLTMAIQDIQTVEADQMTIDKELTAKKNDLATALKTLTITRQELVATESNLRTTNNNLKSAYIEVEISHTRLVAAKLDLKTTQDELSTAKRHNDVLAG